QLLGGQGGAFARVHGGPLFKADQRMRLLIEREQGNLVGGGGGGQDGFGVGQRQRPEVLPSHAGARIHEQDDLASNACGRFGSHGLLEKRPSKTQRQETEHQAAQNQQKNIFQPISPRYPRRGWLEKHDRTERDLFLARSPNEVKHDRQRHSQRAEQKQWRQEAHTVGGASRIGADFGG